MKLKYIPTIERDKAEIQLLLKSGNISDMVDAIWSATCTVNDYKWSQNICLRYSDNKDPSLRGASLQGLSNIARTTRKLDKAIAKPLLLRGKKDADEFVRSSAETAIKDINLFFKWHIGKKR